jgi:hypothetical protein
VPLKPRFSTDHVEHAEGAQDSVRSFVDVVFGAIADAEISLEERNAITAAASAALAAIGPLAGDALVIDNAFRMIGVLAATAAVTPWATRVAREAIVGERELAAMGIGSLAPHTEEEPSTWRRKHGNSSFAASAKPRRSMRRCAGSRR